jgi:Predicted transcriptional regulator
MTRSPAENELADRERPHERVVRWASDIATRAAQLDELTPLHRAVATEALAVSARAVIGELATVRRKALAEARDSGMSLTQIAGELGVSVQAISKAIKKDSPPYRPEENDR